MNNLYGKFSANPSNYMSNMIVPMDVVSGLPGTGWDFAGEFGPFALAEQPLHSERRRFYNVATGASITGYVRAMMWRAVCSSKRPIYMDTDALLCEEAGATIEIGKGLGQWKYEGAFDRVGIGGKKLYIMRGADGWWIDEKGEQVFNVVKPEGATRYYATASKGAKLTHAQLWRVASGKTVNYESESPTFSVKKPQSFTKRKIRKTAMLV
jgi:hypothetical protein